MFCAWSLSGDDFAPSGLVAVRRPHGNFGVLQPLTLAHSQREREPAVPTSRAGIEGMQLELDVDGLLQAIAVSADRLLLRSPCRHRLRKLLLQPLDHGGG